MKIIRRKSILFSCAISIMYTSGVVAAFISLLTLAFSGRHLTPFTVFTLLAIINVLRNSALRSIGEGSQFIYEAYVSFDRIQKFLLLPELQCVSYEKHSTNFGLQSFQERKLSRKVASDISDGLPYFDDYVQKFCTLTKFVRLHDRTNVNHPLGISNLGLLQSIVEEKCQTNTKKGIKLTNVTCQINGSDKVPLNSINFEANEKTLTVISGPVGSGKSTLLSLMAGEISVTEGHINRSGTVAYVPQIPWVFSGTLRENILFGRPFDYNKYIRVINACALEEDIAKFPDRDNVIIGGRGANLSGGQKTRVSLARAVYADSDIYLLDNPLTALDANVSDFIFKHCILEMLTDKVRLMVSHQEYHMNLADQVVILRNGTVLTKGKFLDLNQNEMLKDILQMREDKDTGHMKEDQGDQETPLLEEQYSKMKRSENRLFRSMDIPQEDRMTGTVSFKLYWDYLRAGAHPVALAGLLLIFILCQGNVEHTKIRL